jgi:nucleoside-diphosphate-sugar epimerase
MKILITGANGTIGADLVNHLSKDNFVYAFYRTYNLAVKKLKNKNIRWFRQDLKNKIKINFKPDVVIHSVVTHPFAKNRKYQDYIDSNIIALKNVLEFCAKKKVNKFIYLSSFKIYGDISSKKHNFNNNFVNPDILGATKILSEKIIEEQKINYINLRLPGVISYMIRDPRRPWLNSVITKLNRNLQIEIFNKNLFFNNVIDTFEIFRFINFIIKKNRFKKGTIDFTASKPIKIKDIINFIKRKINSKSLIKFNNNPIQHYTISTKEFENKYKFKTASTAKILDRYLNKFI